MARLKAPKQSGNKFTAFADKLGPLVYEGLRKRGFTSRAAYDNVMSQLAWESTYGTSDVARNNHNYGGYGYDGNGNYTVFKNDRDFIDAYLNTMSSRYRKALQSNNVYDYARVLKTKGYYGDTYENYSKGLAGMSSLRKAAAKHYHIMGEPYKKPLAPVVPNILDKPVQQQVIEDNMQQPFNQVYLKPVGSSNQQKQDYIYDYQTPQIQQTITPAHTVNTNRMLYLPPIEQTMSAIMNGQPLLQPGFANGKDDDQYYNYMIKLARKKARDWKMGEDEALTQMLNDNTYDYRMFYDKDRRDAIRMLKRNSDAHFSDIGKTVYHPTFSNESIYSGVVSDANPLGIVGGTWSNNGHVYTPSVEQLSNGFNYNKTRDYLNHSGGRNVIINIPR